MSEEILLKTVGINKSFNGIQVLKNVNFELRKGEVHALMGENGAGKSTLIKIITGAYTKDSGEIYVDGQLVNIHNRQDSIKAGIAVIYQELSLIPSLTVYENIFIGQEITKGGFNDNAEMRRKVVELTKKLGFDINPDETIETMTMAKRQMVEILKALMFDAKLIIMDEPTASISAAEQEKLFETIQLAKANGTSIIYISHRLEEVYATSDRLTVMRDGQVVQVLDKEHINPHEVVSAMIGKDIDEIQDRTVGSKRREDIKLEVKHLSYMGPAVDISFTAYGGEVLGIGGLVGSGRTEILQALYGTKKRTNGEVTLNGERIGTNVKKNIKKGFAYVPEDRRGEGFIPLLSIEKNLNIANYDRTAPAGWVSRGKEVELAQRGIKEYDIRPAVKEMPVMNLSGGNQQKVVIGRSLLRAPKVLLLDEPTAGIDVGVKAELYRIIRELANNGTIVIMVSSDLDELCRQSDRILVMNEGRFCEEFTHEQATQERVLLAASGVKVEEGTIL